MIKSKKAIFLTFIIIFQFSFFYLHPDSRFTAVPNVAKAYPGTIRKEVSFTGTNQSGNNLSNYTLLIYMIGSDLEAKSYAATKNILQMENPGPNSKVNVIIETGGGSNQTKIDGKRFIDFTDVQRHKVTHNNIQTLVNLGKKDMGDPQTLSDFLIWGISNFPAKKYAIILWDHGSGLNGFGQDLNFNNDILTLPELKEALLTAEYRTNTPFELIGFDACTMSSLEVAAHLKNVARYMIASEEAEPSWGWNYTAIIQNLSANSNQSGSLLGKAILDSYLTYSKYLSTIERFGADKELTLAVIDMTKIPRLVRDVNTLTNALIYNIHDLPSVIGLSKSIALTEHYGQSARGSSGFVDLSDLVLNIQERYPFLSEKTKAVRDSINAAVIYKSHGDARPNANGLSVYMPLLKNEYSNSSELFVISPEWLNLLYSQRSMINIDKQSPIIKSVREGDTIKASVYGSDVAKIYAQIITNSSKGHNLMYIQNIEPSSIDGHGYFQYKPHRILVVCNETKCVPASMKLESDRERRYAFIPVRLESSNGAINQDLSLIYEVGKNGKFLFLGARPEIDPLKTIPKEWFGLAKYDKIFFKGLPSIIQLHGAAGLSGQELLNSTIFEDLKGSLLVDNPEMVVPRYINSTVPFSISFVICDYSDNCDKTRWYSFNNEKFPIIPRNIEFGYDVVHTNISAFSNAYGNFSTYVSPTFGFKLQYPSYWIENKQNIYDNKSAYDDNLADYFVVKFSPPRPFSFGPLPTTFSITATDWPFKESPKYSFDFFNNTDNQKNLLANNVEITHLNSTSIVGNPAFEYTIKYRSIPGQSLGIDNGERIEQSTNILMNHRMYNLDFTSYSSHFYHYLPIIKKIIGSFGPYSKQYDNIDANNYSNNSKSPAARMVNGHAPLNMNNTTMSNTSHESEITDNINYLNYTDPVYRYKISYPFYPSVGGPVSLKVNNPNFKGEVFTLNANSSESAEVGNSATLTITPFQRNETQQFKHPPIILSSSGLRTFDIAGIISNVNSKISQLKSTLFNFTVLNSSEIMFKNYPAYVIEYKYFNPGYKSSMQETDLITIIKDHLFIFEYDAKPSTYYAYFPIFQKMINSFTVEGQIPQSIKR